MGCLCVGWVLHERQCCCFVFCFHFEDCLMYVGVRDSSYFVRPPIPIKLPIIILFIPILPILVPFTFTNGAGIGSTTKESAQKRRRTAALRRWVERTKATGAFSPCCYCSTALLSFCFHLQSQSAP